MPAIAQPIVSPCATCQSAPMITQAQPMYYQAPMAQMAPMAGSCGCSSGGAYYAEPGCSYDPCCGGPAMVSYGGDCGSCGSCGACGSCDGGCSSCGGGCSNCNAGPPPVDVAPTPSGRPDPGPGPGA
jgi:hypothetical protein